MASSRERSMPLPPTKGAIPRMHSRDDLGPIEEPRGSTIPTELLFPKVERTRGRKGGEGKTLRPSSLQNLGKKFDGTGDPYDHVVQYRQLLFAEGITKHPHHGTSFWINNGGTIFGLVLHIEIKCAL